MRKSELSSHQTIGIVVFRIGDISCGLDITWVQEINKNTKTTSVGGAPKFVKGIINLRGEIVTTIDMQVVFGMPAMQIDKNTRNLIVRSDDEQIGFLVNETSDIIQVDKDDILPPPSHLGHEIRKYISGVYLMEEELVAVVGIQSLLAIEK
jgi:purine-binding chemotaxis protein CheW